VPRGGGCIFGLPFYNFAHPCEGNLRSRGGQSDRAPYGCPLEDRPTLTGKRALTALELDHNVARPAMVLDALEAATSHEKYPAELRESLRIRIRVSSVTLRVRNVDMGDPASARHRCAPWKARRLTQTPRSLLAAGRSTQSRCGGQQSAPRQQADVPSRQHIRIRSIRVES